MYKKRLSLTPTGMEEYISLSEKKPEKFTEQIKQFLSQFIILCVHIWTKKNMSLQIDYLMIFLHLMTLFIFYFESEFVHTLNTLMF